MNLDPSSRFCCAPIRIRTTSVLIVVACCRPLGAVVAVGAWSPVAGAELLASGVGMPVAGAWPVGAVVAAGAPGAGLRAIGVETPGPGVWARCWAAGAALTAGAPVVELLRTPDVALAGACGGPPGATGTAGACTGAIACTGAAGACTGACACMWASTCARTQNGAVHGCSGCLLHLKSWTPFCFA